jgi:hypothetical protein
MKCPPGVLGAGGYSIDHAIQAMEQDEKKSTAAKVP